MRIGVVDEGQEALDHVEWGIVLAQGEKGVGTVAFLRRRGTGDTAGPHRRGPRRGAIR